MILTRIYFIIYSYNHVTNTWPDHIGSGVSLIVDHKLSYVMKDYLSVYNDMMEIIFIEVISNVQEWVDI